MSVAATGPLDLGQPYAIGCDLEWQSTAWVERLTARVAPGSDSGCCGILGPLFRVVLPSGRIAATLLVRKIQSNAPEAGTYLRFNSCRGWGWFRDSDYSVRILIA